MTWTCKAWPGLPNAEVHSPVADPGLQSVCCRRASCPRKTHKRNTCDAVRADGFLPRAVLALAAQGSQQAASRVWERSQNRRLSVCTALDVKFELPCVHWFIPRSELRLSIHLCIHILRPHHASGQT